MSTNSANQPKPEFYIKMWGFYTKGKEYFMECKYIYNGKKHTFLLTNKKSLDKKVK